MTTIATVLFRMRGVCRDAECEDQSVCWIRVRGDLTSAEEVVEIAARLRRAGAGKRRLVVDATRVDAVDTKFVALLVELLRRARSSDSQLAIIPSPALQRWMAICRVDEALGSE